MIARLALDGHESSKFAIIYRTFMGYMPVADLGGTRGMRTPWGSKFFKFHAVFGKFWQNRMLAPPGELAPLLGEILDPPLHA